jgi:hypothetical protein
LLLAVEAAPQMILQVVTAEANKAAKVNIQLVALLVHVAKEELKQPLVIKPDLDLVVIDPHKTQKAAAVVVAGTAADQEMNMKTTVLAAVAQVSYIRAQLHNIVQPVSY